MPEVIKSCRICGNSRLLQVVDLGIQALTGVFPKDKRQSVTSGPLRLVHCGGNEEACGLLQLDRTYDLRELYGDNYGYRSGLNATMVTHLRAKVRKILDRGILARGDMVVDIGSNDGTTLGCYPPDQFRLVGVDPTGAKFRQYYPPHVRLLSDFFSLQLLREHFVDCRAKVITSFSMLYDLEEPLRFMNEVHEVLDDDGIWVFEQSYMPRMLQLDSYDTICHEHLEYYGLRQIKWMTDRADFRVIDVEINDVNGGSFSVTVAKTDAPYATADNLNDLLSAELKAQLHLPDPYHAFAARVAHRRDELRGFLIEAKADRKTVHGLGASTKGNVILQYCQVTEAELPSIGEVNSDKFGCYTPGTLIPIVPQDQLFTRNPDYLLVLPWHFRNYFEQSPKFSTCRLVFPLPRLTLLDRSIGTSDSVNTAT